MCNCSKNRQKIQPNIAKKVIKRFECKYDLNHYKEIDSSAWKEEEKAVLRSLINTHGNNCYFYEGLVENIQSRYQ